ncbi:peptide-methionine (R)-S-oxide reductase MsrB [uncultured Cohaesibacter sp.]|uniref:peptide-methionine (R)-S-oxide reductase MsrB n=1 Tax=uncultured Cohaesibacter sp. TaxID=1002546 RepID=UPI0029C6D0C6|nr:peptide-methionine (R)-S-oxide reductase MsrB [uncultured Cohaesibacter sp.]
MKRRTFLLSGAAALLGATGYGFVLGGRSDATEAGTFPLQLSDAEWRKRLSEPQFAVLRKHGTEKPFTSPLNNEKRAGTFQCAGCKQALYSSETKYDSGTGWPSFYQALPDAVGTQEDTSFFMTRIEVHCSRCGGHLGHIFDDGPQPTGKRHCINGVAMTFQPKTG